MKIGKALLLVVALVGAYVTSFRPAIIVQLVARAFSLAAALLFPVLRINNQSAIAGMVVGLVSRLTPPLPQRLQEFVDNIRYPKSAEE